MKKDNKIDLLMREALTSDIAPDKRLNERIIREWDCRNSNVPADNPRFGKGVYNMKKRKMISFAAMAAVCILAISTTAVAAIKYLSKDEIVSEAGNEGTEEAFGGDEVMELNETLEAGGYCFKLYAAATREGLIKSGLEDSVSEEGGTYVVLSIERTDGVPMPEMSSNEYADLHFFVSPLIQGLEPWRYNIASMGGAFSTIVKNGVLYRIIECDDIALFADRQVYLCITDTDFYPAEAYDYHETDGTITRKEGYQGINLLMNLPIDSGRADEAAALTYLRELEASWEAEPEAPVVGANGIISTGNPKLDEIILKEREKDVNVTSLDDIPIENLLNYALLEENFTKEVTVGEDRTVEYSYSHADGSGGNGVGFVSEDFFNGKTDVTLLGYGYSDSEAEFQVCRRDAGGTVRFMVYVIR
ncbi:MAG: hypothetical protein K2N80_02545 [Lachnospiraceae bacterium]|nr:hypothetical protein [Lachnospiraceae bacterium]